METSAARSGCQTGRIVAHESGSKDHDVRVMVVDDQLPFREAARAVIERLRGFDVIAEAASGEEALTLARTVQPDLVLMDINLGGIDGIETTRRLTTDRPETVVVLLSTYQLADLPPAARTCGARAYLNKDDLGVRAIRQLWASNGDPAF
jgi:two-component system, NarL family, invasion response regulator UvrY